MRDKTASPTPQPVFRRFQRWADLEEPYVRCTSVLNDHYSLMENTRGRRRRNMKHPATGRGSARSTHAFPRRFFLSRLHLCWNRCVEEVVWDDRGNMLGTGGRLYLDGDLGEKGCNYGVHIDTGWWVKVNGSSSGTCPFSAATFLELLGGE